VYPPSLYWTTYSAEVSIPSSSVWMETPCHGVSSFDHFVTQWMSTVTSSLGNARNSSHVQREFFWVSKPGARHSQNIAVRPDVGIVIFDSTVPISTGKAVYLAARAEQVTAAAEIERGMSVFSRRSLERGGRVWTPDDVALDARLRLYRATASEQFVLSPEDERLPLHLE
jgi:hypothetical protein